MVLGKEILYLSSRDVGAVEPTLVEVEAAVARAFAARAANAAVAVPKLSVYTKTGPFFQALAGALDEPPLAALKWVGASPANAGRGLPHINALVVLNDLATGVPVAIMDGNWITTVRAAAVTAVAARHLARPESATIGFVACGLQARSHLAALRVGFPIRRVYACARRRGTAEAFAREARREGLEAVVAGEPRRAVEASDIVVTSVPAAPGLVPFLDPAWLPPGSFASLVDLGRSWLPDGLTLIDRLVTDDHEQSRAIAAAGKLPPAIRFRADLADVVSGRQPGRRSPEERVVFIAPGVALGDLAIASLIYERARAGDVGLSLPL